MSEVEGSNQIPTEQIRSYIERIERLEEEKSTIAEDLRGVYAEAKHFGFDTKALRRIVAYRRKDKASREEEEAIFELYANALGLI